jgi:hypothetical protein
VLVFLVVAGNSFWCYVRTKCTIQLCGCVSFFDVAGKLIFYEYLTVTIVSQKYRELSLQKNWSHIKPMYKKTNSLLLCMGLQPYSHTCFSKNIENFVWFPKQYLLGFFLLEKQLANILDRGFLFLRNTLLLYSLSPYSRMERQTEKQIHLLCVGWRNLFSSCAVESCQFLILAGIRFWFTYY